MGTTVTTTTPRPSKASVPRKAEEEEAEEYVAAAGDSASVFRIYWENGWEMMRKKDKKTKSDHFVRQVVVFFVFFLVMLGVVFQVRCGCEPGTRMTPCILIGTDLNRPLFLEGPIPQKNRQNTRVNPAP